MKGHDARTQANENAQRCAAEGSRLKPRRDRRIRCSKSWASSNWDRFGLFLDKAPSIPIITHVQAITLTTIFPFYCPPRFRFSEGGNVLQGFSPCRNFD